MHWRKPIRLSSSLWTRTEHVVEEGEAVSRRSCFIGIFWLALLAPATVGAQTDRVIPFDIPRQRADQALIEFAEQADVTFIFPVDETRKITANAVRGKLTQEAAIQRLLEGTGLHPKFQPNGELIVKVDNNAEEGDPVKKRGLIATIIATLAGATAHAQDTSATTERLTLEEVIVTAQKREERLQDVPIPVTAISGESLITNNQPLLRDYYSRIPGLNLTDTGIYGGSVISFRGITSGLLNGNTATVVVDDVPYGISANPGGPTSVVPEIDPNDLERIEALRGPQGTLYGASSLGGLLKYVTVEPSIGEFSGFVRGGSSAVRNGDGEGYNVGAGINVPLAETWAVRASGTFRRDPGYIDDPVHGLEGVNQTEVKGGRVSLMWRPSDDVTLKLGALYQHTDADGNTYFGPTVGFGTLADLQQVAPPATGGYHKVLHVYTAHLAARAGNVDIAAISAYSINEAEYLFDLTSFPFYAGLANANFAVAGAKTISSGTTKRFTQELRATIPLGEKVTWLVGAFYANEDNPRINSYYAINPATGQQAGTLATLDFPSRYDEKSAFTDITYSFTDQFDVQVGGRLAYSTVSLPHYASTSVPGFLGNQNQAAVESKNHSFTYLLTPRFRFTPDLMLYARLASGYRPGGPNLGSTSVDPTVPAAYQPDETRNYEVGMKGSFFERRLNFDASVYYIDWQDIQLQSLIAPTTRVNYKANGGDAKSEGVDLSVELRPTDSLTIATSGAWNIAELSEAFPTTSISATGARGDRLPFSSRFSGSISVDQRFPLGAGMQGYFGASGSYVGDRKGPFVSATTRRADLPSYFTTDLRAGVRWSTWDANLYVNNVADKRGLLMGGAGGFLNNIYIYNRPRTVGLNLSTKF